MIFHAQLDAPILLVDDEASWLRSLSLTLEVSGGFQNVISLQDGRELMALLGRQPVSLILLDLIMPTISGEDLLVQIAEQYPDIPVIVLSGLDQVDTAVKCMREGAFDFFVKTTEAERLVASIHRALSLRSLKQENDQIRDRLLRGTLRHPEAFEELNTCNSKMHSLFQYIEAISSSQEPILVTGESGVGKELITRAIHQVSCPEAPLVPVNVAGLDDNVFSDSLFGHVRGAYTGADRDREGLIERAEGGILFLDEIGDLSSVSQVKLLRLLQEKEYLPLGSDRPKRSTARIVCATNHDLEKKVQEGQFRNDLFFRLRSHHMEVPPLRERKEDIPILLDKFLTEASEQQGKTKPTAPDELRVILANYSFPGNVRELRAMVHDAVSLHQRGKLSTAVFRKVLEGGRQSAAFPKYINESPDGIFFPEILPTLKEAAQLLVTEAMKRSQGNQSVAAGMLGITRQALSKRLKKMREG